MSREEAREFLPLYALGALSPAERKAVEAALQRDPELWTELAPLLEGASLLAEVPPEPLPPGIEARLFPRRRSRPWTLWPLAAAAALVLVVLGWRGLEAWSWIQALRSPQGEVVALVSPHGGVVGQAWLGPGRRALVLLDLPPPPPGRVKKERGKKYKHKKQ
jgi:anti-sigma factor RsiW